MKKPVKQKNNSSDLTATLGELRKIVAWFEDQENIDLEEGIKKVKEGTKHLATAKAHLKEMDNQFKEVEKLLES